MPDIETLHKKLYAKGRLVLNVKVIPRASQTVLIGRMSDGTWKIQLRAVPEAGKANAELCSFLAKLLKVAAGCVSILHGKTARHKIVSIVLN